METIELNGAVLEIARQMSEEAWERKTIEAAMDFVLSGAVDLERLTVMSSEHSSDVRGYYHIDPVKGCTCKDAQFRSRYCKHFVALRMAQRATDYLNGEKSMIDSKTASNWEDPAQEVAEQTQDPEFGFLTSPEPDDIPDPEVPLSNPQRQILSDLLEQLGTPINDIDDKIATIATHNEADRQIVKLRTYLKDQRDSDPEAIMDIRGETMTEEKSTASPAPLFEDVSQVIHENVGHTYRDYPSTLCIKRHIGQTELSWTFRGTDDKDTLRRAGAMIRKLDDMAARHASAQQSVTAPPAPGPAPHPADGAIPLCPIHGSQMAPSQYGGFYCKRRTPDGEWCKEKVKG